MSSAVSGQFWPRGGIFPAPQPSGRCCRSMSIDTLLRLMCVGGIPPLHRIMYHTLEPLSNRVSCVAPGPQGGAYPAPQPPLLDTHYRRFRLRYLGPWPGIAPAMAYNVPHSGACVKSCVVCGGLCPVGKGVFPGLSASGSVTHARVFVKSHGHLYARSTFLCVPGLP